MVMVDDHYSIKYGFVGADNQIKQPSFIFFNKCSVMSICDDFAYTTVADFL